MLHVDLAILIHLLNFISDQSLTAKRHHYNTRQASFPYSFSLHQLLINSIRNQLGLLLLNYRIHFQTTLKISKVFSCLKVNVKTFLNLNPWRHFSKGQFLKHTFQRTFPDMWTTKHERTLLWRHFPEDIALKNISLKDNFLNRNSSNRHFPRKYNFFQKNSQK